MAMTVTVALDTDRDAPIVTVAGINPAGVTYTIERASPSGNTAGIRGHVGQTVDSLTVIARDYEAPLDLDLVYTATVYDGSGAVMEAASSAPFKILWDDCASWLIDLARPTNSLVVMIQSLTELAYDFAAGVHRVLNRRAPVLTTLPAYTPAGELDILTGSLDEREQVRALLGNAYPILVRTSPDQGIGNMYLGVTQFIEERFLTLGTAPERRFRITVVQVERPNPAIYVPLAPNTWQNVKDTFPTWADVKAAGTWDDLAYTYPVAQASPIAPWLPDDI